MSKYKLHSRLPGVPYAGIGSWRADSIHEEHAVICITTVEKPAQTIVTIDGELLSDSVISVEACCNEALSKGKPVQLLLHDVSIIDQGGRALLCRMAARGVELKATGVYTSYVVDALRAR